MSEAPDWLGLLRAHTDRFADVISDADLDAPVTFCPGWSLRDLVIDLGGVHQWAAHAVVEGNPHFRPPEPAERGRSGLAAWYRHHAGPASGSAPVSRRGPLTGEGGLMLLMLAAIALAYFVGD